MPVRLLLLHGFIVITVCSNMQIHTVSAISYYTHHSFHCPCTGTPLTQVGYASLQIFIKIIIADCINLRCVSHPGSFALLDDD